jgi:hypothetical protein
MRRFILRMVVPLWPRDSKVRARRPNKSGEVLGHSAIGRVHSARETRGGSLSDGGKSQRQCRSPSRVGCFCIGSSLGAVRGVRRGQDRSACTFSAWSSHSLGAACEAEHRGRRRSRPRFSSNPRVNPSLVHKKARSMSGPNRLVERLPISSPCPRRVAWRASASPF